MSARWFYDVPALWGSNSRLSDQSLNASVLSTIVGFTCRVGVQEEHEVSG